MVPQMPASGSFLVSSCRCKRELKKYIYLGSTERPVPVSYWSNVRWFIHSSETF